MDDLDLRFEFTLGGKITVIPFLDSLRKQTYFRLLVVSAENNVFSVEPVTAGNTPAFHRLLS